MSTIINIPTVNTRVYNAGLLSWENAKQPVLSSDTVNVTLTGMATAANQSTANTSLSSILANTNLRSQSMTSGSVSGLGNNAVLTPSTGKKLRVSYLSYNPALAVEAAFRFGAGGTLILRNSVTANAVVAKDFGDMRYIEGAVDEPLYLNLSIGVATLWNALYTEVTP